MKFKDKTISIFLYTGFVFLGLLILGSGSFFCAPALQYEEFASQLKTETISNANKNHPENLAELKKEILYLKLRLENLNPGKQYLVINSTENTFKFYKNNKLVRQGICSTGSYIELDVGNNKTYKFRTPKGVFTIKNKIVNPVWKKPDWAFIEDGLTVPPPNDNSRFQYGVLGDYAMNLGHGYLIHGTLYQRFLGMSVTHGCVRLNVSDLKFLYENLPVGSKVFIY